MLLLSNTPAGLQVQLEYLQSYCDAKELTVNAAKTQVMILRPGGRGRKRQAEGCGEETFTYAGLPLEQVSSLKYLGLTFAQLSPQLGYAACADVMADAGCRAMFFLFFLFFCMGGRRSMQQDLLGGPAPRSTESTHQCHEGQQLHRGWCTARHVLHAPPCPRAWGL
jgi:hypothetical protein